MGIMLPSFVSCGFENGFKLVPSQLETINAYRTRGKQYIDEETVMEVLRYKDKKQSKTQLSFATLIMV